MLGLMPYPGSRRPLRLLCIGAHGDDLEIGCGGTLKTWLSGPKAIDVTWIVLSATQNRAKEARRSAQALLRKARRVEIRLGSFKDGHLSAGYTAVKNYIESLKEGPPPDIILTHTLEDRHQDHRLIAELTWNTFRDHMILEYEIPKYEGDLGKPNVYVPLTEAVMHRKAAHLQRYFGSQRGKHWFTSETFMAVARLRGLECRAAEGYAEAFHGRKLVMSDRTVNVDV